MSEIKPVTWFEDPAHFRRTSRREFVFAGLAGGLGLTLGNLFKLQAEQAAAGVKLEAKAQSLIHIYLPGGCAHQETWDPKPFAPIEYRGPLGTVDTKIPGVKFSQYMQNTAKIADKITVVRSMTHGEAAHERGTHNMFTGYRPSPALQYPSIGSVVSHELGSRNNLPPYVAIPNINTPYAGTGYLGSAYGAFALGSDPASGSFSVRDLTLPGGVDVKRFEERREMRAVVDAHFSRLEKSDALSGMDSFYERAYAMVSSAEARAAFDIKQEPQKLRDQYGMTDAGQRMLLARRLVGAGVRFVSMNYGSWDHHDNIQRANDSQMPRFDQAFSALIRDLDERGMLDTTLVVVTTEFGRTPKINRTAGRDHWPKVFSIVMAGGGMKRGYIHGASDATGGEPDRDPVTVGDYASTIYNLIGINPEKPLMAPGGRPQKIVGEGEVLQSLLA
jgi:hypothetical protein